MNPNCRDSLVASLLWVSIIRKCISVYLHNCIIYRCLWKSMLHTSIVFLVLWSVHKYTSHQYIIQFSWMSVTYSVNVFHWKSLQDIERTLKTVPVWYINSVHSVSFQYPRMHSINVSHWNSFQCSFNILECTELMYHTGTVFSVLSISENATVSKFFPWNSFQWFIKAS